MNVYLPTVVACFFNQGTERLQIIGKNTAGLWGVGVGGVKPGSARPERAVGLDFDRPHRQTMIPQIYLRTAINPLSQGFCVAGRNHSVEAQQQIPTLSHLRLGFNIDVKGSGIVGGGNALTEQMLLGEIHQFGGSVSIVLL